MTRFDDQPGHATRLREAADPSTPPWQLAVLADDPESDVRMTVATNPSASALTILRLRRDVDLRTQMVPPERYGAGA